jgi:hypothetical protein
MAQLTFEKVWDDVRKLPPDELRRLRDVLDVWLRNLYTRPSEDEFERELVAMGLLTEVKLPVMDPMYNEKRQLVEVKGRPISEIIIEERR